MPERPAQTLLAFDFGQRRIGIASGNTLTGAAAPLRTVDNGPAGPDWDGIGRAIRTLQPGLLVVGKPYNVDGTPGALHAAAERFAAALAERFGLPVERVDERYSSLEASARLKQQRHSGQRRRRVRHEDIDSRAAAIILERWLQGEG
ncbi:MAG: Holliday junction resolvase RuvX [Steroidobacteraceae bacterium]